MSGFFKTLAELCFPPRCVGCGARLAPAIEKERTPYFCETCAQKWEKGILGQCSRCNAPFFECRCQPRVMQKAGSAALLKLAPYDTEHPDAPMVHAIRSIKKYPRARTVSCLAKELAPILVKAVAELNEKTPISHTVIAHIPRAKRKVRRFGFDQAQALAEALSNVTSWSFEPLLHRQKDGVEQKRLTLAERQENLKDAFSLNASPAGLRVILVDDVVTTGAGMAEATRLLRRSGAKQVLCVCAAITPKKKGKRV